MDTKPYRFERMTGAEFSAALNRAGLTAGQFRRLTALPEALQVTKDVVKRRLQHGDIDV